jgi:hypothetical protein
MKFTRRVAAGALAGAVGTLAMDTVLYLRYKREGGKESFLHWEFAAGVTSWEQASAPGQLGEKVEHALTGQTPPDSWARPTTNLVHWATGVGWGMQYGALSRSTSRHPKLRARALGPAAWLSGYVVLPLAKVYKPIWEYDSSTLAKDLSAHLVFGRVTSAVYTALTREKQ